MTHSQTGVLLINLGTPDAPDADSVRRYLQEFLMDPRVIDIPYPLRWLLVHGIILRTRPARSAEAYRKVWTPQGSPLLTHTLNLASEVQKALGDQYVVEPCMRYGKPSIESALMKLQKQGVSRSIALPLYPQYSLAATESSIDELKRVCAQQTLSLPRILPDFHSDRGFISVSAQTIEEHLKSHPSDHLLFSFHGLPERQVKKTDLSTMHCLQKENCCDQVSSENALCYRAQSFATARAIAKQMQSPPPWSISFQSRLGITPWIQPYTDHLLDSLPKQGIKRLAVACPSFVADCLETLEEIQIRGREQFIAAGGESLTLIPCLNSDPRWAKEVARIIQEGL